MLINQFQKNVLQILANQAEPFNTVSTKLSDIKMETDAQNYSTDDGNESNLPFLANMLGCPKLESLQNVIKTGMLINAANVNSATLPQDSVNSSTMFNTIHKNLANVLANNTSVPESAKEHIFSVLVGQILNRTNKSEDGDCNYRRDADSFKRSNGEDSGKFSSRFFVSSLE